MFVGAKSKIEKRRCEKAPAAVGAISAFARPSDDPAKQYVMSRLRHLVSQGAADCELLDNGDVKLRFRSGETYVLGDIAVTRIA